MEVRLTDWAVNARTAADILGVPVETFRTWRKRHGLLPQGDWAGSGRAPEMTFQFRHLLQARTAQKLMSVGVPVGQACEAVHYGVFHQFFNCEEVRIGFVDGKVNKGANDFEDVFLTFSLENDGMRIASALADDIADNRGGDVAEAAYKDFVKTVNSIRARSRGEV